MDHAAMSIPRSLGIGLLSLLVLLLVIGVVELVTH